MCEAYVISDMKATPLNIFIAVVIIQAGLVLSQDDFDAEYIDDCRNPDNRPGKCVNIKRCPSVLVIISRKPLSTEDTRFLRDSACGFEGRTPKVCCPSADVKPAEASWDSHQSRQLLPKYPNCGFSINHGRQITRNDKAFVAEFPWVALLGFNELQSSGKIRWACGGSLISDRYVLTAAHCVKTYPGKLIQVRLGEHTISNEGEDDFVGHCPMSQDIAIESTIVHHNYTYPNKYSNDIALIRLKTRAILSHCVRPICLPFGALASENLEILKPYQLSFHVAGWGSLDPKTPVASDVLQTQQMVVMPLTECSKEYLAVSGLDPEEICVQTVIMDEGGDDSCKLDSGSGLMLLQSKTGFSLVGVYVTGPQRCGEGSRSIIYTRVGAYLLWILDNIQE